MVYFMSLNLTLTLTLTLNNDLVLTQMAFSSVKKTPFSLQALFTCQDNHMPMKSPHYAAVAEFRKLFIWSAEVIERGFPYPEMSFTLFCKLVPTRKT